MKAQQLSFLPKARTAHGGDLNLGKRKAERPFNPKLAIHVVLRSARARGEWSMLHPDHAKRVEREVRRIAAHQHVTLYRFVNVGNHLHLLIHTKKREFLRNFLRQVSGAIAHLITGACKGRELKTPFWEKLPYSRLVTWGREFLALKRYLVKNMFEAAGLWNRKREPGLKIFWLSLREAGVGPP
jgi:REP element-mobilizing transposase RayT